MDPKNRRQPVPAGGAPIPATLEAANATPPAGETQASTLPPGANSGDNASDGGDNDRAEVAATQARALIAFEGYEPNDLVEASSVEIERLELAGLVDSHPDAVAHVLAQD